MGFDPITLGTLAMAATTVASGAASASAQRQSAKATENAAKINADNLRAEANLQYKTGLENARRLQQDATRKIGAARLHTATASLLREGSVPIMEQALATRLQTEIQDETAEALRKTHSLYSQAQTEEYIGHSQARAQKTGAYGSLLSGFAHGANSLLKL